MDFGQNEFDHKSSLDGRMPGDKRSRTMAAAAVILGVIAFSTACCFYIPYICGSLGIIFALLSKGGEMTMSQNAKTALWVSVSAVILTTVLLIVSFAVVILQYGSLDAFWKAYMEMVEAYSSGVLQ